MCYSSHHYPASFHYLCSVRSAVMVRIALICDCAICTVPHNFWTDTSHPVDINAYSLTFFEHVIYDIHHGYKTFGRIPYISLLHNTVAGLDISALRELTLPARGLDVYLY